MFLRSPTPQLLHGQMNTKLWVPLHTLNLHFRCLNAQLPFLTPKILGIHFRWELWLLNLLQLWEKNLPNMTQLHIHLLGFLYLYIFFFKFKNYTLANIIIYLHAETGCSNFKFKKISLMCYSFTIIILLPHISQRLAVLLRKTWRSDVMISTSILHFLAIGKCALCAYKKGYKVISKADDYYIMN